MKTDAGWKLWTRNPSAAPAMIAARTPAGPLPRSNAMTEKDVAAIAHTPAARRAHARGGAAGAVGEVDDFEDEEEADGRRGPAELAEVDAVHERQREVV